MEIWKCVPGYEGLYSVSNRGNVKSFIWYNIKMERIIKPSETIFGYLCVKLRKNGKHKTFGVHRLVALTFIPNPLNKKEVNHIDHNPQNNIVSNLEWISHRENIVHSWKNKIRGEKNRYDSFKRKHY